MIGVIVNTLTVILGSLIGLTFKNLISQNLNDYIMKGLGLCVLYIGFDGALAGQNVLIVIISIVIGTIIGVGFDLDMRLNQFANGIEKRFSREGSNEKVNIAEGFVNASLLFCVGAMTIVGSLNAGLIGDNTMLFTKATLDFVSSTIFAASFGIGVLLSSIVVFTLQGGIVLLASYLAPLLSDVVISEMTCVGSILIIALSFNMMEVGKFKVMNYLPAIFLPIALCPLWDWIAGLI